MKKPKIPPKTTLINTFAWQDDSIYTYEEYKDHEEEDGKIPASEDSDEFHRWRMEECDLDVREAIEQIEHNKHYQGKVYVITGEVGRWNGQYRIETTYTNSLHEAIMKCYGNCDDLEVELDNKTGIVHVKAYHHDGHNNFEIREMRSYCEDAFMRALHYYGFSHDYPFELKDGWFQKIKNPYFIN